MPSISQVILGISLVLLTPLIANATIKKPQTIIEFLTNGSETLLLNCSLKGEIFPKKCKIHAEYLGSTMGDAITVYFPNGKKADYRIANYENKTLIGLKDDNANYHFTSTPTSLEIFRNEQSWVKLWKNK